MKHSAQLLFNLQSLGHNIMKQIFLSFVYFKETYFSSCFCFVLFSYYRAALRRISAHCLQTVLEAGLSAPKGGRPSLGACRDRPLRPSAHFPPGPRFTVAPGHPEIDARFAATFSRSLAAAQGGTSIFPGSLAPRVGP